MDPKTEAVERIRAYEKIEHIMNLKCFRPSRGMNRFTVYLILSVPVPYARTTVDMQ